MNIVAARKLRQGAATRIAESATLALKSVEKLRRLAMLWNPSIQAGGPPYSTVRFMGSTSD